MRHICFVYTATHFFPGYSATPFYGIPTYNHKHAYVYVYIIYAYMYVYSMHIYVYIYSMSTRIYIYICVYVYMWINIWIHLRFSIHKQSLGQHEGQDAESVNT